MLSLQQRLVLRKATSWGLARVGALRLRLPRRQSTPAPLIGNHSYVGAHRFDQFPLSPQHIESGVRIAGLKPLHE